MSNFQAARTNMVDTQIHTNGVINPAILESFATIPREIFLPAHLQNVAYTDEPVALNKERFLLDPMTHARMVQALDITPDDTILDIGTGSGYSAAILSSLATTIMAVENRQSTIDKATKILNDIGACNIVFIKDKLTNGGQEHAPYNAIFIGGAVAEIPESLVKQLSPGGRMVTILQPDPNTVGQVTLIRKGQNDAYASRALFESNAPYMAGFEPKETFSF